MMRSRFTGSGRRRKATSMEKPRLSRRWYRAVEVAGALMLAALLFLALLPQTVAPYDPAEGVGRPYEEPNGQFLLGTNDVGQDLFSELIWATRASISTGLSVSLLSVTIGTVVGLYTGSYRNWISLLLLRLIDLTLALPFLPFVILIAAYLGSSQTNVIILLVLVLWAAPARMVRARTLQTIHSAYVEAAEALGSSTRRIVVRHIWPAARTISLVQFVMVTGTAILAEASLSFLGLGDPSTESWGTMLYFAQVNGVFLSEAWLWWVLPAGLMITLSVLGIVLIGYGLERRLEPGLR